jgi:hypothetical protein
MCSKSELTNYDSTIFFFTKVDDPIFCPITHLVSLAIADGAFEAPSLTTVERVFEHKVWGPVVCLYHYPGIKKYSRLQFSVKIKSQLIVWLPLRHSLSPTLNSGTA